MKDDWRLRVWLNFFNGQVVSDDDLEMGDFPPLSGMITQGLGEAEDGLPF